MERRVTSHTEEEEMNQRRRLLTLARKGDQKSIELLFELYQVKVFSGDALKKKKLPSFPDQKSSNGTGKGGIKASKDKEKTGKRSGTTAKRQKGDKRKPKSPLKELKPKTTTTKRSSKKPAAKKATISKKKSVRKPTESKKMGSVKKVRIAKKK